MPSDLGPDGSVRLRAYLPLVNSHWFSGHCRGCGRGVTVGVEAAIALMGTGMETVGGLSRRLTCLACSCRVSLVVAPDTRPAEAVAQEGPRRETKGIRAQEKARPEQDPPLTARNTSDEARP
jgi:hypothetical protein